MSMNWLQEESGSRQSGWRSGPKVWISLVVIVCRTSGALGVKFVIGLLEKYAQGLRMKAGAYGSIASNLSMPVNLESGYPPDVRLEGER